MISRKIVEKCQDMGHFFVKFFNIERGDGILLPLVAPMRGKLKNIRNPSLWSGSTPGYVTF